jgi:hypothetical protein
MSSRSFASGEGPMSRPQTPIFSPGWVLEDDGRLESLSLAIGRSLCGRRNGLRCDMLRALADRETSRCMSWRSAFFPAVLPEPRLRLIAAATSNRPSADCPFRPVVGQLTLIQVLSGDERLRGGLRQQAQG